eukprot:753336-Hanusia_phi.AAC.1
MPGPPPQSTNFWGCMKYPLDAMKKHRKLGGTARGAGRDSVVKLNWSRVVAYGYPPFARAGAGINPNCNEGVICSTTPSPLKKSTGKGGIGVLRRTWVEVRGWGDLGVENVRVRWVGLEVVGFG